MTITDPDGRVVLSGPDLSVFHVAKLTLALSLPMKELVPVLSYARFVKE